MGSTSDNCSSFRVSECPHIIMNSFLLISILVAFVNCETEFKGYCRNIWDQNPDGMREEGHAFNGLEHAECLRRCHARAGATGCTWETDYMDGERCWSYTGLINHGNGVGDVICTRFYL